MWIILKRNYLLDTILEEAMNKKHAHSSWEPKIHNHFQKKKGHEVPYPDHIRPKCTKIKFSGTTFYCRQIMPNFVKTHSVILEIKHECRHNTVLSIFVNFIYFTKTSLNHFISAKRLILPLCKLCCLTDLVFKVYNVFFRRRQIP